MWSREQGLLPRVNHCLEARRRPYRVNIASSQFHQTHERYDLQSVRCLADLVACCGGAVRRRVPAWPLGAPPSATAQKQDKMTSHQRHMNG